MYIYITLRSQWRFYNVVNNVHIFFFSLKSSEYKLDVIQSIEMDKIIDSKNKKNVE